MSSFFNLSNGILNIPYLSSIKASCKALNIVNVIIYTKKWILFSTSREMRNEIQGNGSQGADGCCPDGNGL
jgi:hypothetical protein